MEANEFVGLAITCEYCDQNFAKKSNLYRHIRNMHNVKPELSKSGKKCPLCEDLFLNRCILNNHLGIVHNVELKEETITFESMTEFELWKENEEKKTCSSYTRRHNSTTAQGDTKTLFLCNRDGYYKTQSTGERRLKSQGSCKMDANCPASLVLSYNDKKQKPVIVKYISTHVGHAKELGHIRLPSSGKQLVTEKLKCKIPSKVILDETKSTEPPASRLRYLTSKDIQNIKQSAGIYEEFKLHENDHASVNLWVERLQLKNQVSYFKAQGQSDIEHKELDDSEFLLILQTKEQAHLTKKFCNVDENSPAGSGIVCIDSTHGLGYDMQLTTLMSIDETGAGFPLATMISSKVNTETLTIFFNQIKAKTGSINCAYFMSDDFNGFFNAWTNVMGPCNTKKLLCSWHVDKSWKSHLNMKDEQQQLLYKDLKALQMEFDQSVFEAAMDGLVQKVKGSDDLKHLTGYIERYQKRSAEWAYCYRLDSHLSTNMYLEAYHKKLKYVYFDKKFMKRIDKSLYLLLKLIRDASVERETRLMKNTPTYRIRKINRAHDQAKLISSSDIDQLKENNAWSVKSQSCDGYYIVKQIHSECTSYGESCKIRCSACYVCVHMMTCNCVEAMVGAGLCKHIHAVVFKFFVQMNLLSKTQILTHSEMVQEDNIEDINTALTIPTQQEVRAKKITSRLQSLQAMAKDKLPYCGDSAMDEIEAHIHHIESRLLSCNSQQKQPNFGIAIPANKKIEPQQRMFSVKKKNSKILSLRKPNLVERGQIVDDLVKRRKFTKIPNVFDMMYSCSEESE